MIEDKNHSSFIPLSRRPDPDQSIINIKAMENFVFPDEIKTKWMKMSKLNNVFTFPKIMGKCSKLHFFSSKTSMKCAVQLFQSQNVFELFETR